MYRKYPIAGALAVFAMAGAVEAQAGAAESGAAASGDETVIVTGQGSHAGKTTTKTVVCGPDGAVTTFEQSRESDEPTSSIVGVTGGSGVAVASSVAAGGSAAGTRITSQATGQAAGQSSMSVTVTADGSHVETVVRCR